MVGLALWQDCRERDRAKQPCRAAPGYLMAPSAAWMLLSAAAVMSASIMRKVS